MTIKRIEFMEDVRDVSKDDIDVLVEKEDGSNYIVIVGTPQDLLEEMSQEKTNQTWYSNDHCKKLTKEIVMEAIQAYGEDNGYWLKLYHFADSIDIYILNKLEAEYRKERKGFARLRGLEKLQDDINKLEKLDNFAKLIDRLDKLSDELFED